MATNPIFDRYATPNPAKNDWAANYVTPPDIEQPITSARPSEQVVDRFAPQTTIDSKQAQDSTDALIYSNLVNVPPSETYAAHDELHESFQERLGEYANAGWRGLTKDSILAEMWRGKLPEPFENHDQISKFMEGFGTMAGDLPFYLVGSGLGALAGGTAGTFELPVIGTVSGAVVGGGAGGFGLTQGMRQWLVDKYSGKDISAFSEVLDVLKKAGQGAITGAAFGVAGEAAPLAGGIVGKISPRAYKAAAELATMTTVGALVEGRVPTKQDFIDNAAMFAAMHIGTLGYNGARDYLSKTYVRDGVHPGEVSANPESVAPPVEEAEEPTGQLRPAIKVGDKIEAGEPGEIHKDIQERMKPPEPEPKEEGEQEPEEEKVPEPEPEEGFLDPKGNFLSRADAKKWVEDNEPEVFKQYEENGGGELHSEEYNLANIDVRRGGEVTVKAPTAEVSRFRQVLNRVKEGSEGSKFGAALRTFFVGNRDARIAETNQLANSLRKMVPDYRDQEALSLMRDFKNKRDDLIARREQYEQGDNEKLKKLIPIIDRALNPTPEMMKADAQLTDYFTKRLAEGKKLGFIDSSISNEEYITHLLGPEEEEEGGGSGTGSPQIGRYFRFGRERKYDTILDALETGRVKAQTLNAFDALTIYGQKHAVSASTRIFINELKDTELGKWGYKRSQNIPSDWVEMAPGSNLFRNTVPYIDRDTGEATYAYQNLMVPKKVQEAMKPIIEGSNLSGIPGYQKFRLIQAYIKAAELGLSVFHMKAMNITALNNQGVTGLVRSLASDVESAEFKAEEKDGVRAGLQTPILGRTFEAYRAVRKQTFPTRLDVIRELPGIKQVDQFSEFLTHQTFDVMQRKFKVMDYSIQKARWMAKHPEATDEELEGAKQSIAKEVNAAYGGLNWEALGVSKTFRNVSQALLLAPDWTYSNIFNAKYAFEGGPGGQAARAFWVRSAITGMALTQAMSVMVSGQMSSHPTEVYIGHDKKGKEVYANMFFAGAPKDFVTFINNVTDYGAVIGLAHTIGQKLSPVARAGEELISNRDWMGREIVKKGTGAMEGTVQGFEHVAGEVVPVPFSISNVAKMLTDTDHDYGFWDYASIIGGTPPRHVNPEGARVKKGGTRKKKFSITGK